ncbi:MAG: hypothetical protein JWN86_4726 [Planctomycetota bacterium]|nr:hypothetical protein [Planctomycetota bacterium]
MGRQIAIVATDADEAQFLAFVRQAADVRLFGSFAPTIEGLWMQDLPPERRGHWRCNIWNTAFAWTPEYGQVGPQAHDPDCIGWSYVSNAGAAPVVEFDRSFFRPIREGRLYWAKTFSMVGPPRYDMAAFEAWYDSLVTWVRRHGTKEAGRYQPYYLPDALARRQELA